MPHGAAGDSSDVITRNNLEELTDIACNCPTRIREGCNVPLVFDIRGKRFCQLEFGYITYFVLCNRYGYI